MTQTLEEMRYQLEEWLAQGFTSPEDRANYQTLKEQDEVTKAEYLDLVAQLDELDQEQADYYRKQLA
ncbi:Uncharacterised protein [Streptococcus pneumoniae]|uniref:DUF5962 family protein n=1 Tax=Streptococcus pneumoniae TaxID=1313 RepID=UPI0005E0F5EF|nr:DUF5962 family protein [Streptococcus pneumoniae]CMX08669.1 Uncharacterised protein [Streptococcus pneumoniae]SUO11276.1 Uncharacterised protein [Streptococcus pneumoniae]HEU7618018.1 hypothetical protein [Streptococcus pneumoniae]